MSTTHEITQTQPTLLDWRGLKGPEAIVSTARAVKRLAGRPSVLRILADDDAFPADLASWCRVTRSQLLQLEPDPSGGFAALVRVNDARDATHPVEREAQLGHGDEDRSLDLRGMPCPEPILALARVMRTLAPGSAVEVLADDPAFPMDVQGWCRSTGASLAALEERGGVYRAVIRAHGRHQPRHADTVRERDRDEVDVLADRTCPRAAVPPAPACARAAALPFAPAARDGGEEQAPAVLARGSSQDLAPPAVLARGSSQELAPPAVLPRGSSHEPAQPGAPADRGIRADLGGLASEELAAVLDSLSQVPMNGALVTVTGSHRHFARHVVDWCARGGHGLVQLETSGTPMTATVCLHRGQAPATRAGTAGTAAPAAPASATAPAPAGGALALTPRRQGCAIQVLRGDMEAVLAALLTANEAAAAGMPATILFAFWGINVLRADRPRRDLPREKVPLVQRVLEWMMVRGPQRQRLGKLSFGGAGGLLVRFLMRRRKLLLLEDLMQQACALDVRFLVCTMSMALLGVTRRDLVDLPNLELGGVPAFVASARESSINLVF